jgi:uncharacterized membrane protein YdcZ (DUF606 family)
MSGEKVKSIVDAVVSHPKSAGALVVITNEVNMRFADYEPIIKIISSSIGILLVTLLCIKAMIDIYKSLKAN